MAKLSSCWDEEGWREISGNNLIALLQPGRMDYKELWVHHSHHAFTHWRAPDLLWCAVCDIAAERYSRAECFICMCLWVGVENQISESNDRV